MALKDKIEADRKRVFVNRTHFASEHTWNGMPFVCVTDEEAGQKRGVDKFVEMSWDVNTRKIMVYVREEDFPGRPMENEHGFFDEYSMRITQVQRDMGMLGILLESNETRAVAEL